MSNRIYNKRKFFKRMNKIQKRAVIKQKSWGPESPFATAAIPILTQGTRTQPRSTIPRNRPTTVINNRYWPKFQSVNVRSWKDPEDLLNSITKCNCKITTNFQLYIPQSFKGAKQKMNILRISSARLSGTKINERNIARKNSQVLQQGVLNCDFSYL